MIVNSLKKGNKDNLNCNCPVCSSKNLDKMINEYTKDYKKIENISFLNIWYKIQDVNPSFNEFDIGRKTIMDNSYKGYINNKDSRIFYLPQFLNTSWYVFSSGTSLSFRHTGCSTIYLILVE
jgi:hypothetical protein